MQVLFKKLQNLFFGFHIIFIAKKPAGLRLRVKILLFLGFENDQETLLVSGSSPGTPRF